jgi:hypothetical protein
MKSEVMNFHTTNFGWNYYVRVFTNGSIKFGRYQTNGSQNSQHEETVFVKPEKIQIPNIDAYLEANKTEYPSSDMRIAARNECEWAMNHVQNQGKGWNK